MLLSWALVAALAASLSNAAVYPKLTFNWVDCDIDSYAPVTSASEATLNDVVTESTANLDADQLFEAADNWLESHSGVRLATNSLRMASQLRASLQSREEREFDRRQTVLPSPPPTIAKKVQCALVNLPMIIDADFSATGKNVTVFLKRFIGANSTATSPFLWVVQGGPGPSSDFFDNFFIPALEDNTPNPYSVPDLANYHTFYLDHPGTGRSTFLNCSKSIEAGNELNCFKEINSTYTLEELVRFGPVGMADAILQINKELLRQEGSRNSHVYTVSYGTNIGHKLLSLATQRNWTLSTVFLDGNCPAFAFEGMDVYTRCEDAVYDYYVDQAGRRYFNSYCKNNTACSAAFGGDPIGQYACFLTNAKTNTSLCSALLTSDSRRTARIEIVQRIFSSVLLYYDIGDAAYMLQLLLNCDTADAATIMKLFAEYFTDKSLVYRGMRSPLTLGRNPSFATLTDATSNNDLLYYFIVANEWRDFPFTIEQYSAMDKQLLFKVGSVSGMANSIAFYDTVPIYAGVKSSLYDVAPTNVTSKIVIMIGMIDGQTSPENGEVMAKFATSTVGKKVYRFSPARHGSIGRTPYAGGTADCGQDILGMNLGVKGKNDTCATKLDNITFSLRNAIYSAPAATCKNAYPNPSKIQVARVDLGKLYATPAPASVGTGTSPAASPSSSGDTNLSGTSAGNVLETDFGLVSAVFAIVALAFI